MRKNLKFLGNLAFASKNAFIGQTLSRRDDLISLCYLLVSFVVGLSVWEKECLNFPRDKHFHDRVSAKRIAMGP
jgi:hypothetical protein